MKYRKAVLALAISSCSLGASGGGDPFGVEPESGPVQEQDISVVRQELDPNVRKELDQLKDMNQQLLRRIQSLENQLQPANPAPQRVVLPTPPPAPQPAQQVAKTDVVRKAPKASRGIEDLVLEEHTLFDQTFSLELGFELAHFDRSQLALSGFLALDAIFLGLLSVDETDSDIYTTSLTGRWGVTDRLQLNLTIPWVYREQSVRSGGAELASVLVTQKDIDDSGIGDINFGFSYRLYPETLTRPDIVWNLTVVAPTGEDPYGIDFLEDPQNTNLLYPESLPTGTGLWAIESGFSFLRTTDPAIIFANIAWRHYFEESFDDLGADPTAPSSPGDVQLGDQLQLGVGLAFAINERTSLSTSFTQKFFQGVDITQNGSTVEVPGSETSTGTFNVGVTYGLTNKLSMVTNLGMGLTNDSSDYTFTVKFPYRF